MKTVVYEKYGPPEVLQFREVAKPVPGDHEILVKVYATTVTVGDSRMRSFTVPRMMWLPARLYLGILRPKRRVLGMELAGEVEAVGSAVTRFKPGDAVMVSTASMNFGGYAEYKCMPEDGMVVIKPQNLTFEETAAMPGGGGTALRCLRLGNIQRGQSVMIYGASGAVGTNAVQLAKYFGAEVTAVCSTANLALVKSLGADHVIDYTREDLTRHSERYDLVFDAVGKLSSSTAKQLLNKTGLYLNVLKASGTGEKLEELIDVRDLVEAGNLKPVIDRCYPLEQIVEAHRYVDQGHKKGNVTITVAHHN